MLAVQVAVSVIIVNCILFYITVRAAMLPLALWGSIAI